MSCEERLRTLGLSSLENRMPRGDLMALCNSLRRERAEGGASLYSLGTEDGMHGNGTKLCGGKFTGYWRKFLYCEGGQTLEQAL